MPGNRREVWMAYFPIERIDGNQFGLTDVLAIGTKCTGCKLNKPCRKPSMALQSLGTEVSPLPAIKEKGLDAWIDEMWQMYLTMAACLESEVYVLRKD